MICFGMILLGLYQLEISLSPLSTQTLLYVLSSSPSSRYYCYFSDQNQGSLPYQAVISRTVGAMEKVIIYLTKPSKCLAYKQVLNNHVLNQSSNIRICKRILSWTRSGNMLLAAFSNKSQGLLLRSPKLKS